MDLFRNFHLSIIVVTYAVSCAAQQIWKATNFSAVTYFEGIEGYYQWRHDVSWNEDEPPHEPDTPRKRKLLKMKICKRILKSHFFRMRLVEWVNIESESIFNELRSNYRQTFYSIYNEYEFENRWLPATGRDYDYENAYKIRRVRIDENRDTNEFVFVCVARDRATARLKEYFVSQAYNVNKIPFPFAFPIAGRLIFEHDENNEITQLVALAEEASVTCEYARLSKVNKMSYLGMRINEPPTMDIPDLNPVCSLSTSDKLRLCSILFGESALKKKVHFSPVIDNVQGDCEKKRVSIGFWNQFPFVNQRRYEEWVIGCKALNRRNNPVTYYVSRGDQMNRIFVFWDANGDQIVYFYNYYVHVSVVGHFLGGLINNNEEEVGEAQVNPAVGEAVLGADDVEE